MKALSLFILFLSLSTQAEVLKQGPTGDFIITKNTFKAGELLEDYGRLLKLNLTIMSEIKDEAFEAQGELLIPKEQIESYVSTILSFGGSAMIREPGSQFVRIIEARDVRYSTVPVYDSLESLPENDNHAQFSYQLKHITSSEVARNLRPFLSRYGRIIDMRDKSIYVSDSGKNLRRIAHMIKAIDTQEYHRSKEEQDKINEKHKKSIVKEKAFLEILNENQIIFIVIFFLMGSIIGFGTRGYMMKKVEGGW